ncbi:hypothetical protein FE249_17935 (plasmid) [Acidiphilium multivorum]|uniref:hypothetical protein n=1 Tax=Acidiphilium multivorum TaxID=62140 RepID=UPI001F4C50F7|nr:hypothetical protein [Acidiphilium multivorum]UNC16137.1 hypothetical protein FE249_17935 [Acidiphilium multivorum]
MRNPGSIPEVFVPLPAVVRSLKGLPLTQESPSHQVMIELVLASRGIWPSLEETPNLVAFSIGLASAAQALSYEPKVALAHDAANHDLVAAWVILEDRAYDIGGEISVARPGTARRHDGSPVAPGAHAAAFELDDPAIQEISALPGGADPSIYLEGLSRTIQQLESTGMAADFRPAWDMS